MKSQFTCWCSEPHKHTIMGQYRASTGPMLPPLDQYWASTGPYRHVYRALDLGVTYPFRSHSVLFWHSVGQHQSVCKLPSRTCLTVDLVLYSKNLLLRLPAWVAAFRLRIDRCLPTRFWPITMEWSFRSRIIICVMIYALINSVTCAFCSETITPLWLVSISLASTCQLSAEMRLPTLTPLVQTIN